MMQSENDMNEQQAISRLIELGWKQQKPDFVPHWLCFQVPNSARNVIILHICHDMQDLMQLVAFAQKLEREREDG